MTFDDIRRIALSFPEVEEYRSFDSPAFRIRKRFLACIAKIDPDTLVLKVPDQREREYHLATNPDVYYLTDHYVSFQCLLVRMPMADPEELRQLFAEAWLTYAPKTLVKDYLAKKSEG